MNAIPDRTAPGRPLRLLLAPERRKPSRLDGAWWPRSNDLLRELPSLASELDARWGRVTRITVHPAQWPVIPRRVPVAGHVVHAGWYAAEQDKHTVMLCSYGRRMYLMVVPPQTDAAEAGVFMAEASDPRNTGTASELLARGPVRRGETRRQRTGALLASAVCFDSARGAGRPAVSARGRAAYWPPAR
ncbi:DUF5994 family protein [Kitasatospora cineracea]|uniref:Uncharacterized protein n=1 Tax=Kitasatospora cineracea TaxID=88074 RepID=A0A3N4RG69_9ACTN|nr:DUF5994 family protein [Kitasatospora cineracea]RPE31796.1 hypothetical protein EDD38_0026 [Kitasatospora cineracea]